ncbi:oxidoreductase [Gordonia sp. NPDC003376]
MTAPTTILRTPMQIGTLTVPGRVIKSATSETRSSETGFVTDELLEFYEPMVRAGTPMIITGNLYVSLQGKSANRQCGIDADDKIAGLREWTELAHRGESAIIAQLNHGGRQIAVPAIPNQRTVSASAVREPLYGSRPRPLRLDEMPLIARSFADAAERAHKAGFDGVQIHAAHGYLLNQFLTPHTNRRTDAYGGTVDRRMRLLREVFGAIRERVGDEYPILMKVNGTDALPLRRGASLDDMVHVGKVMQEEGLDAIEISRGHYESWPGNVLGRFGGFVKAEVAEGSAMGLPAYRRWAMRATAPVTERVADRIAPITEGFNLPQAERFTASLSIPVICVGGFHTAAAMAAAIHTGRCDAVSVARAFVADPLLYQHLDTPDQNAPVCGFCNGCIARHGGMPITCYSEPIRGRRDRMLALLAAESPDPDPSAIKEIQQ